MKQLKAMNLHQHRFVDRAALTAFVASSVDDASMVPFLLSNIQLDAAEGSAEWKFDLPSIARSLDSLLLFPPAAQPNAATAAPIAAFTGPLLLVKASNSTFVLSKHLSAIKDLFASYSIVSIRDCGHWMHAEKPDETANLLAKFVASFENA